MPLTGPRLSGKFLFAVLMALVAILPRGAFGEAEDTPYAALARLASALSNGDAAASVAAFDPQMKGYGSLAASLRALAAQAEVLCAIEILEEKISGGDKVLDTDWYLQIKSQAEGGPTERRRERVSVSLHLSHGTWRIVSMSSTTILAPINIRPA